MAMEVEELDLEPFEPLIVGLQVKPTQADADEMLEKIHRDNFDYCVTRLPHATDLTARNDVLKIPSLQTWRTTIVGEFPPLAPEEAFSQETWQYALEWALHMSLPAVILPPLPVDENDLAKSSLLVASYARLVEWAALECRSSGCRLWIPIFPLDDVRLQHWRMLMQYCRYPNNVGMLIQLQTYTSTPGTPSSVATAWLTKQLHRLHVAVGSGSIFAIRFPCDQFLTNKKGYPTLSKIQQTMLTYLLRRIGRRVRLLLQGPATAPSRLSASALGATQCLPHLQYLQHMRQRAVIRTVLDSTAARLEADYLDGLQQPLQPLKDHLENQTYDVFEKDPVKYREYGRAIGMALQDRASQPSLVLMVVGAGRGPLVTAAIEAYQSLPDQQRPKDLAIWAVEKNPSAARRLLALCQYEASWKHVKVLQADLRHLTAQAIGGRAADIVVSELLGSLGCNELSPECLDGLWTTSAVHNKTVSIPTSYTSHVAPVASVKLWQQARQQSLYPNRSETDILGMNKAMETGYVVRPHEASQMMSAKDCWTFQHPRVHSVPLFTDQHLNDQSVTLDFEPDPMCGIGQGCGYGAYDLDVAKTSSPGDDGSSAAASQASGTPKPSAIPWTLTGLLGTFTTVLYRRNENEGVYLSTCPDRFSVGMFSWFPLYFPLENPLTVPPGSMVRVHLWRKVVPDRAVWYEWAVGVWKDSECLSVSPIHNPGGRSSRVSL